MAVFYVYRCTCGREIEDQNPSLPICESCGTLMPRALRIFRGTACKNLKDGVSEQERGIAEWETEQKVARDGMRERKRLDRESFRDYCAAELHHKHGNPDEAATYDPVQRYRQ